MRVIQRRDNTQHDDIQHNNNTSPESKDNIFMDRREIMASYLATSTKGDNNDQNKCDDKRREGELSRIYHDNTVAGDI